MSNATALLPLEDYLHTSYSPDLGFVDGELPNPPIYLDLTDAFAALD